MQIVSIKPDGTVVVEMSAEEAAQVRDDLGNIWTNEVSQAGDKLHSLLEWSTAKPDPGP